MRLPPISSPLNPTLPRGRRRRIATITTEFFSSLHSPPPPPPPPAPPIPPVPAATLPHLINSSLHLCPAVLRRLWRAPSLLPHHFPPVLRSFLDSSDALSAAKIRSLWFLFTWAQESHVGSFRHLPSCQKAMILLLIRARFLGEARLLFDQIESCGVDMRGIGGKIYGEMISGLVHAGDVEKAVSFLDRARVRGVALEVSCCETLLRALMEDGDEATFLRVYMDLVELGFSGLDRQLRHFAVEGLCEERRVLEAADLLRRVAGSGEEIDQVEFNVVADGYCCKHDFDDLMSFLRRWNRAPSRRVCNRIVYAVCENLGVEEAVEFLRTLEDLGFAPGTQTFTILIGWSCREGNLRDALLHLSDLLSRNLDPDVHCYNAIICGLFKEGMWRQVKDVLLDMADLGIKPDALTFRVMLAGYSKERQFDDVRFVLKDMEKQGMVSIAPLDDPLFKVFVMLGLGHLNVKVKRCNEIGVQKAEFHDSLGNGLYLDAVDIEEYDRILVSILDDAMVSGKFVSGLKDKRSYHGRDLSLCASHMPAENVPSASSPSNVSKTNDITVEEMLDMSILDFGDSEALNQAKLQVCGMKLDGLQPDMSILNSMLDGFINENNFTRAGEVFCHMLKKNIALSVATYTRLVHLNCSQARLRSALCLKDLFTVGEGSQLITLYNILIFSIFQTQHSSFIEYVLNEIGEKKLTMDRTSYELLIHGYHKCLDISKSIEMFYTMIEKNLRPSSRSFETVICYLCNNFEVSRALELTKTMELWGINLGPAIQGALIDSLISLGKLEDAKALLTRFQQSGLVPDSKCYDNLIRVLCIENRVTEAIGLLNIVLKSGTSPSQGSYNSVLHGLLRHEDFDQALDFIVEMHHNNLQPSKEILIALVQGLCGCRRTDDARMVLELSSQSGETFPDHIIYSVIDSYVAKDDPQKASDFMYAMQKNGHFPDFKTHWSVISNLSHSNDKRNTNDKSFLSNLLSQNGFPS